MAIKCTNWHSSNDEEISPTTFREIRVLKKLQHENIVNLIEVCRSKKNGSDFDGSRAYLVFEFCEHDLAGILKNSAIQLVLGEIRNIAYQLLTGVAFIHSQRVISHSNNSFDNLSNIKLFEDHAQRFEDNQYPTHKRGRTENC